MDDLELEATVIIECGNCYGDTPHILHYLREGEVAAECTECLFTHFIRSFEVFDT